MWVGPLPDRPQAPPVPAAGLARPWAFQGLFSQARVLPQLLQASGLGLGVVSPGKRALTPPPS